MIAYNYKIVFLPEPEPEKVSRTRDSFTETITIVQSDTSLPGDALTHEMVATSNQGRGLKLYCSHAYASSAKEKRWFFEVEGVLSVFWNSGSQILEYTKGEDFSERLLHYWVLHVVLPVFFIIEGVYDFLHAGAVEIDGKPVLFIAPSMGGKSTMTDYFMRRGHTMISDDKVATFQKEGNFYAVPSHPHNRPYRNREDLGFYVENFAQKPKPMQIIYLLDMSEPDATVKIDRLLGIQKIIALRNAKEMNLFFPESEQLDYLAKIARHISLFRVTVPRDLERLDEVYGMICAHSRKMDTQEN
jgi:hypothetical protein